MSAIRLRHCIVDPYHLNSTAERHFALIYKKTLSWGHFGTARCTHISLREMQIADGEICALHKDGEVATGATRQVLDLYDKRDDKDTSDVYISSTYVAIAAVFSSWDSTSTLLIDLLAHVIWELLPNVSALRLRRKGYRGHCVFMLGDQPALAFVPGSEQLSRRRSANETRVRHPGKSHAGDMAGGGVYTYIQQIFE